MKKHLKGKTIWSGANLTWLVLTLLAFFTSLSHGQQSNILIGTEHKIQSRILGEERRYVVNLPSSYEKDEFYTQKKYPVLILLDGDTHFHAASGIIRYMGGNEQIPEMIVVAVSNTNRTRDFTPTNSKLDFGRNDKESLATSGGGANFLHFLDIELLPQINKDYRTLPYRLLVGHSLGGLFAVDSFLNQKVFSAYIAIDPSLVWDDQAIVKKARSILATNKSFKSTLYIAQANNPFNEGKNAGSRGEAFQSFNTNLASNKSEGLRHSYAFFENEDHFSVPLISLYNGLLFIFEDYKFPLNTLSNKNASDVRKHYEMFSQRLGVDIPPPGKLINNVAYFLLNSEKKIDKAIELFKLNKEYYPESFVTFNSLGDAYKAKRNKELAIFNYRKSLEINPNNEKAKMSIKELTQDQPLGSN
jgi:predicted alpha/beta superfamily hydrolase